MPALRASFIWDDDDYVTHNATLLDLSGLKRIWLERGAVPQYYPLVHTSFWVEHHLWGLNATGYHALNIALHALAAILIWRTLLRLQVPGGLLAASLFAVHPVQVESVAWITERKNVLSTVFYFAAALAWLRFAPFDVVNAVVKPKRSRRTHGAGKAPHATPTEATPSHGSPKWYALSLGFFMCALLSKTVACSLPAALLLVVWWKRGRVRWSDVRAMLPFFAAGLALAANTAWMEKTRVGASGADWSLSVFDRLLVAGRALWFYAAKLVWPMDLAFVYPRWHISSAIWWQWLFPAAALAVIIALWLGRHRIGRAPLTAVLFFAGTLVPALGFVNVYPMRFSFVADHYQYLASVGIFALAAAALARVPMRAALVLPLGLAALSWRQAHVYHDLETLWTSTLARNPNAWLAQNNLGTLYLDRGQVDDAIAHYRAAVNSKPDYYEALSNLGAALLRRGAVNEAWANNEQALRLAPDFAPALVRRGAILLARNRSDDAVADLRSVLARDPRNAEALNVLGSALGSQGDYARALAAYTDALAIDPALTAARVNLARVLLRTGRIDDADAQVQEALRRSPGDADAANAAGQILLARGRVADAATYYRNLVQRFPNDATARFNLGTLLSQAGHTDEAIEQLSAALRINPRYAEARNNLGIAFIIARRLPEAKQQFAEALRLRPDNPEAHYNLAHAFLEEGRRAQAIEELRAALRLRPDYPAARSLLRELDRDGP